MSDDSGVQIVGSRSRKVRPHSPMSETSSTPGPSSRPPITQASSSNPQQTRPPPSLPPPRYAGDGLDFRRPVLSSSSNTEDVIDLTNEPDSSPQLTRQQPPRPESAHHARLPRFGREIMEDVVNLEEDADTPNHIEISSSPEIEFVGSTTRPQDPAPTRGGLEGSHLWRMIQNHSRLGGYGMSSMMSSGMALGRQMPWAGRLFRPPPPQEMDTLWIGDGPAGDMDLTVDLDVESTLSGSRPNRASPVYKPPSPPPEGFTRTAGEDQVVVCPNCDEELGVGDETKQQIWVVKNCGHVYCGECAQNRSLSKAKKSSQKVNPFAKCQATDCGKPVSAPRSMFQVYL